MKKDDQFSFLTNLVQWVIWLFGAASVLLSSGITVPLIFPEIDIRVVEFNALEVRQSFPFTTAFLIFVAEFFAVVFVYGGLLSLFRDALIIDGQAGDEYWFLRLMMALLFFAIAPIFALGPIIAIYPEYVDGYADGAEPLGAAIWLHALNWLFLPLMAFQVLVVVAAVEKRRFSLLKPRAEAYHALLDWNKKVNSVGWALGWFYVVLSIIGLAIFQEITSNLGIFSAAS